MRMSRKDAIDLTILNLQWEIESKSNWRSKISEMYNLSGILPVCEFALCKGCPLTKGLMKVKEWNCGHQFDDYLNSDLKRKKKYLKIWIEELEKMKNKRRK